VARHEPQDIAEWSKGLSIETVDNMRWYNDYAPIHEARYPLPLGAQWGSLLFKHTHELPSLPTACRHAEITAKVYPGMKSFEDWLAKSNWLSQ
jgi:hypothetical protein